MYSHELLSLLKKYSNPSYLPTYHTWPQVVAFPDNIWEQIYRLYEYTSYNMHEYESSVFYVDDTLVLSPPHKGDKQSVTSNHRLEVSFKRVGKGYLERISLINGKVVDKEFIKESAFRNKVDTGFLFNVHTHPKNKNGNYSFFSMTDMNSLMSSSSLLSGVITDELWLICKTASSNLSEFEKIYTNEGVYNTHSPEMFNLASNFIKNAGFVVYKAKFKQKLIKL